MDGIASYMSLWPTRQTSSPRSMLNTIFGIFHVYLHKHIPGIAQLQLNAHIAALSVQWNGLHLQNKCASRPRTISIVRYAHYNSSNEVRRAARTNTHIAHTHTTTNSDAWIHSWHESFTDLAHVVHLSIHVYVLFEWRNENGVLFIQTKNEWQYLFISTLSNDGWCKCDDVI